MNFLCASYRLLMNVIENLKNIKFCRFSIFKNVLQSSYELLRKFLWASYELLMDFIWTSYLLQTNPLKIVELFSLLDSQIKKNFLWPSYRFLMNILWTSNNSIENRKNYYGFLDSQNFLKNVLQISSEFLTDLSWTSLKIKKY